MRFRDPNRDEDPPPQYDTNGNLFTMCLHTHGEMGGVNYIGGNLYKFDYVKRDIFSIESLKKFSGYMGNNETEVLYTKNDEGTFVEIGTENDIQIFSAKAISEGNEFKIYIVRHFNELSDVEGGIGSDNSDGATSKLYRCTDY